MALAIQRIGHHPLPVRHRLGRRAGRRRGAALRRGCRQERRQQAADGTTDRRGQRRDATSPSGSPPPRAPSTRRHRAPRSTSTCSTAAAGSTSSFTAPAGLRSTSPRSSTSRRSSPSAAPASAPSGSTATQAPTRIGETGLNFRFWLVGRFAASRRGDPELPARRVVVLARPQRHAADGLGARPRHRHSVEHHHDHPPHRRHDVGARPTSSSTRPPCSPGGWLSHLTFAATNGWTFIVDPSRTRAAGPVGEPVRRPGHRDQAGRPQHHRRHPDPEQRHPDLVHRAAPWTARRSAGRSPRARAATSTSCSVPPSGPPAQRVPAGPRHPR